MLTLVPTHSHPPVKHSPGNLTENTTHTYTHVENTQHPCIKHTAHAPTHARTPKNQPSCFYTDGHPYAPGARIKTSQGRVEDDLIKAVPSPKVQCHQSLTWESHRIEQGDLIEAVPKNRDALVAQQSHQLPQQIQLLVGRNACAAYTNDMLEFKMQGYVLYPSSRNPAGPTCDVQKRLRDTQ